MKKAIWMAVAAAAWAGAAAAAEKPAEEAAAPKDGWTSALNAGLTMTDGNSETLALNAGLAAEGRKAGLGSVLAGVEFNYGESTVETRTTDEATGETVATETDEKTVENAKAHVNAKKTLTPRTFAYADGAASYDDIALIDYRATLGPGLGFYLLQNARRELALEAGPAYLWEEVDGVRADYVAVRCAERYACQATKTAKLVQALEYVAEAEDFDNYKIVGEIGLEAAMSERLNLRVAVQDKYNSQPAAGKEYNDVSLIAGVGLSL